MVENRYYENQITNITTRYRNELCLFTEFCWNKKSAEQGYAAAQNNLGVMYNYGEGTLKDPKQAFYWYKKSAEQGYATAQYNLGSMYYDGEGTEKDLKQAAFWIKKSYENGNEEAKSVWERYELYNYQ